MSVAGAAGRPSPAGPQTLSTSLGCVGRRGRGRGAPSPACLWTPSTPPLARRRAPRAGSSRPRTAARQRVPPPTSRRGHPRLASTHPHPACCAGHGGTADGAAIDLWPREPRTQPNPADGSPTSTPSPGSPWTSPVSPFPPEVPNVHFAPRMFGCEVPPSHPKFNVEPPLSRTGPDPLATGDPIPAAVERIPDGTGHLIPVRRETQPGSLRSPIPGATKSLTAAEYFWCTAELPSQTGCSGEGTGVR